MIPSTFCCNPWCGDGVKDTNEQCDNGTLNQDGPYPIVVGQNISYCNTTCKTNNVIGPYCGDGSDYFIERCNSTTDCSSPNVCSDGIDNDCLDGIDWDSQIWTNGAVSGWGHHQGRRGDDGCKVKIGAAKIVGGVPVR
jgi:hypothetical protein